MLLFIINLPTVTKKNLMSVDVKLNSLTSQAI